MTYKILFANGSSRLIHSVVAVEVGNRGMKLYFSASPYHYTFFETGTDGEIESLRPHFVV